MAPRSVWAKSSAPLHPLAAQREHPAGQACEVLEVAPTFLLTLDGLKKRLEIALAEAERAVALDHLEEHCGAVADGAREDLQEVAVFVAVDEDAAALQLLNRDAHLADALAKGWVRVVRVGGLQELHTFGAHGIDRGQDVVGGQGKMLHTGALVELEELVDLALLLGDRRLVEGELDPVVAIGDHLAHQR